MVWEGGGHCGFGKPDDGWKGREGKEGKGGEGNESKGGEWTGSSYNGVG